jgi:hypothetical protein
MTPFDKQYITFCLKKINEVLNSEAQLQEAITSYTQGNAQDLRYLSNRRIPDAALWSSEEQLKLSAAVFVADADAAIKFCKNPEDTALILNANQLLLNQYIPLITRNSAPKNRFLTVKKNIAQELAILRDNENLIGENPYTLFAVAAGVVAVGLAALLAQPSKLR